MGQLGLPPPPLLLHHVIMHDAMLLHHATLTPNPNPNTVLPSDLGPRALLETDMRGFIVPA